MTEKLARARLEAYSMIASIPSHWATPKFHRDLIESLLTTTDNSLNHAAGRQLVKDRCDELSLVPGQPDYSAEAWEGAQRGQRRVPSGDDLLCFSPGDAGDAQLERLTAAMTR